MRSFGRSLVAAAVTCAVGWVLSDLPVVGRVLLDTRAHAQATSQPQSLFNEAVARETALRKEMDAQRPAMSSVSLLRRIRVLVTSFEDLARLFPDAGSPDKALWHGAALAADAFWQFGEPEDRTRAAQLLDTLTRRYPDSVLVKQVPAQTKRLADASTTRGSAAFLRAIRREVLPDVLRITIELEREVPFRDEKLDAPPRVFVDLQDAAPVTSLKDVAIPYSDDVVRQVRVGRQLDSRTRVVLDLSASARYSVYALYNPFRVVVDFERAAVASGLPVRRSVSDGGSRKLPDVPVLPASTAGASRAPASAPAIPPEAAAANSAGGFSLSRQLGLGIAKVVIDPGHGGLDPGAKARGLSEAEIVLDIALRLEKLLLKQPGVEVVLTRRANSYVPLEERTAIANRAGADLFLSIHANASSNTAARGVETYYLNFAPNPEAEAIAARENAGSTQTMRQLPDIVRAIALNNKFDESRDFAAMMQASLHERLRKANRNLKNLGVKQAPFMVLIGATMPSVLAEISFLSNKQEADLLKTEKYRQQIAEALLAGVMKYQQSLKKPPAVARR